MRISRILFTNQPLDELEEEPGSIFASLEDNEVCHICTNGFSLLNKKYCCAVCKMPVCLNNSTYFDSKSRICDNCRHEQLVEEVWKEKKAFKDQIIKNIQKAIREASEKEHIVKTETERIEELKLKVEEFAKNALVEEAVLEKEVEHCISDNNSKEKLIEKLLSQGKSGQEAEMEVVDKMAKAHEKLQILKIEVEEGLQERSDLQAKIEKVKTSDFEPNWAEIKKKVCKICYLRISRLKNTGDHSEISEKICSCISF